MASGEKVLKEADLAFESQLDLFQIPVSNLGVSDVKYVTYRPLNQFSTEGNVKFRVPGAGSSYIDLREIFIRTTVRIMQADGKPVPGKPPPPRPSSSSRTSASASASASEKGESTSQGDEGDWSISVCNLLADSLWHQCEIRMNDTVVLGGMTGYSYASLLNILLDETDVTDEELQCAMFYKDTAGYLDNLSLSSGGNRGLKKRADMMKKSRSVELRSRLQADICKVNKYLINGVDLDLTLFPTSSAFRLMTANSTKKDYVLEIQDVSLLVKQVTPSPQVLIAHQSVMKSQLSRARYFYLKEDIRKFTLSRGVSSYFVEDGYNGRIPSSLAIAFVSGSSFLGNIGENPYNFQNFEINNISVSLSGSPTPGGPLTFDFDRGKYLQGYCDLYAGKNKGTTHSQRITLEEFGAGYSLFVVHLNPQNRDTYYPTSRDGSVRIELRFSKPLPHSVILLTRVTYPSHYEIDYQRNVYLA